MVAVSLTEICQQLDDLAIKVLLLMEDLMKCKHQMEEAMKSGYFNIAKTRYITGNKTVCTLQLPSEDKDVSALSTIISQREDMSGVQYKRYELQTMSPSSKLSQENETKGETVRKRTNVSDNEKESSSDSTDVKNTKYEDPIKWFGILVPQNLRLAQSSFKLALEFSVENANIQAELDACLSKYQELRGIKILMSNGEREP